MRSHLTPRNAALFAAGGLVAALFLAGAAHAITDTVFKYSSAQTAYLAMPVASFVPFSSGQAASSADGISIHSGSTATSCFFAPVNLPQGALMTELAGWYSEDGGFITLELARQRLSAGQFTLIVAESLADTAGARASASFNITDPSLQAVDNQRYNYEVISCFNSSANLRLYGARVTFTYTKAGD